ncbi:hypothetical protein ACEWAY_22990, partial [Vibrio parahaemolyticus]
GVEYDAEWKLGKVTLGSSGSYNDAALSTRFCPFSIDKASLTISQPPCSTEAAAALAGTRLPRQPRFKGNTSIRYETTLGRDLAG